MHGDASEKTMDVIGLAKMVQHDLETMGIADFTVIRGFGDGR
jgi:hypothetical protein